MVEVGDKADSAREAQAEGWIQLSEGAFAALAEGNLTKGDALSVARIAGIQGAKKTSDLIPLCHPLALTGVKVELSMEQEDHRVRAWSRVRCTGPTGVEMEALTAASAAALTVYDMCKAIDKGMVIHETALLSKTGGKSGDYHINK